MLRILHKHFMIFYRKVLCPKGAKISAMLLFFSYFKMKSFTYTVSLLLIWSLVWSIWSHRIRHWHCPGPRPQLGQVEVLKLEDNCETKMSGGKEAFLQMVHLMAGTDRIETSSKNELPDCLKKQIAAMQISDYESRKWPCLVCAKLFNGLDQLVHHASCHTFELQTVSTVLTKQLVHL